MGGTGGEFHAAGSIPGLAVDMVNHPPHYKKHPSGVEVIQITEHLNFCLGNAVKYPWPLDTDHNRKVFGMMMSEWLSQRTGLPIDLQIQTRAESDKYMGKRNALGVTI